MKYLKKINESFDKSDYYIDITDKRYQEWMKVDPCDVSDGVRSRLIDLGLMFVVRDSSRILTSSGFMSFDIIYILSDYYSNLQSLSVNISTICEIRDEYFIVDLCFVEGGKKTYKCDQFEGLVQLLLDKEIIKVGINESFDQSDYYTKIEYSDYIYSNCISIEKRYYNELRMAVDPLSDYCLFESDIKMKIGPIASNKIKYIKYVEMVPYVGGYKIYIYQCPDEYFIVSITFKSEWSYYRCDQFEGLMRFLGDKKVIVD